MSGFAGNDAVVGEGVLSSRITHAKLGAEARGGDLYIFSGDLPKTLNELLSRKLADWCLLVKFGGNTFLYTAPRRGRATGTRFGFSLKYQA